VDGGAGGTRGTKQKRERKRRVRGAVSVRERKGAIEAVRQKIYREEKGRRERMARSERQK
jgi:hypothetical protein